MSEVDPGAEDAPPGVFRMSRRRAPEDADLDHIVEEHEVDGRLEGHGPRAVLCVEKWMILQRHVADAIATIESHRTEVDRPRTAELGERRERFGLGLRHRVNQMSAATRVGEYLGEEDALVDLQSPLVLLREPALGVDLGTGGDEAGMALRGGIYQLRDPQGAGEPVGQLLVDRLGLVAQSRFSLEPLLAHPHARSLDSIWCRRSQTGAIVQNGYRPLAASTVMSRRNRAARLVTASSTAMTRTYVPAGASAGIA
jgi:hypothetical protein